MTVRILNNGPTSIVVNVWETDSPRSEGHNVERYDLRPGQTSQAIEVRSWSRGITVLEAEIPDVDRAQRTLTDGSPVTPDHRELRADGQQKGYVVLSAEERARGFVRPVRTTYTHKACGTDTRMGRAIAETYARDPGFYSGTFCVACGGHFPLDQFVWKGTDEQVGS